MLKRLKVLREERGISQQKLADVIGMSQSSINDYENRGIEPDITTLIKIADYFETSVDFIIGHTDIRRQIEEVKEYDLNRYEEALINKYRLLRISGRRVIDDLLTEMSNQ